MRHKLTEEEKQAKKRLQDAQLVDAEACLKAKLRNEMEYSTGGRITAAYGLLSVACSEAQARRSEFQWNLMVWANRVRVSLEKWP